MNTHHTSTQPSGSQQKGAVTFEFALMFIIFFVVLYGTVTYALTFLVQQGLTQAAAEGARASIRLDQLSFTSTQSYETAVSNIARDATVNALNWLPTQAYQTVTGNITTSWSNGTKQVITGGKAQTITTKTLTVTVTYPGYANNPLIPAISFPGWNPLSLPTNLVGQSSIQLQL